MVKSKIIEQNGIQYTYHYSDEGKFITRDNILYFDAVDPIGMERDYQEVDKYTSEQTVYEEQQETIKNLLELGVHKEVKPSDKFGYDWVETYVNGILITKEYVEVKEPEPLGTEENPIEWQPHQILVPNAFYTHDNILYVYMGKIKESEDVWDNSDESFVEWYI